MGSRADPGWAERYRFRLLLGLGLVAFMLRVWALDRVPPGLDNDEVSIGYNAYCILKTGRDEYGVPWPLAFRAFGEYKRPVYIYAAVPSLAVFGPTPFGVRLPAALAGALAVAAIYAVAVLLLRDRRAALAAAALLALSPWHLQFTRAAREVSVLVLAILTLAAALLAALRAARGAGLARALGAARAAQLAGARAAALSTGAALAFLVALYSYPGAVIFAPLLVVVLLAAYRARVRAAPRRWLYAAGAIVAVGAVPLAVQFVDGRARQRPAQAAIFQNEQLLLLAQARMERDRRDGAPWLLQHPLALSLRVAADAYLSHFDTTYLFTRGDAEWRHHSSDSGQLYLWDAPLLLAGLYQVARHWRRPALPAIAAWLAIGPLPAAFAEQAPHAVRSIGMLPAWYLLAAAGVRPVWQWLRRRGFERDWLLLLGCSVGFYLYMYYVHYPVERGRSWWSGELEGFQAAQAEVDAGRYDRVVIAQHTGLSHLYALFGTRYDPATYLAHGGTTPDADAPLIFPPFERRIVDWQTEPRDPRVLYAMGGTTIPRGGRVVKRVPGSTGDSEVMLVAFDGGP